MTLLHSSVVIKRASSLKVPRIHLPTVQCLQAKLLFASFTGRQQRSSKQQQRKACKSAKTAEAMAKAWGAPVFLITVQGSFAGHSTCESEALADIARAANRGRCGPM